jgi:hypothetical protein
VSEPRPHEPGRDVVLALPNPKWKVLGFALLIAVVAVVPYLIDDPSSGRIVLLRFLGPLLGLVALWMLWWAISLFRTEVIEVVVGSRYVDLPAARNKPARRIALEDIERVMRESMNHRRSTLYFELADGTKPGIPALMLPEEIEHQLVAVVLRRSALRKAGVDSRDELAAAEAYLETVATGARPFGVRVSRAEGKKKRSLTVLAARADVDRTAEEGGVVYIPASVHAVLASSGGSPDDARPLRGVG